jgi:hypothetical protein
LHGIDKIFGVGQVGNGLLEISQYLLPETVVLDCFQFATGFDSFISPQIWSRCDEINNKIVMQGVMVIIVNGLYGEPKQGVIHPQQIRRNGFVSFDLDDISS